MDELLVLLLGLNLLLLLLLLCDGRAARLQFGGTSQEIGGKLQELAGDDGRRRSLREPSAAFGLFFEVFCRAHGPPVITVHAN